MHIDVFGLALSCATANGTPNFKVPISGANATSVKVLVGSCSLAFQSVAMPCSVHAHIAGFVTDSLLAQHTC